MNIQYRTQDYIFIGHTDWVKGVVSTNDKELIISSAWNNTIRK